MTEAARILIVDDNEAIHADFRQILDRRDRAQRRSALDDLERALAGVGQPIAITREPAAHELCFAFQGEDAVRAVKAGEREGRPFSVAFVDIRMPPGIDGIETIARMWQHQPGLEVVLCSAYSDYSWEDITRRLDPGDRLVVLRKPFDPIEVRQLAACLATKWQRGRLLAAQMHDLERQVQSEVEARLRERARHEEEQRRSQRLETLGQLAAGIAHEINTPAQFASFNLEYLADILPALATAFDEQRKLLAAVMRGEVSARDACTQAELLPIMEDLCDAPRAIADARTGLARITKIVQSVRRSSYLREREGLVLVDVNEQVRAALELAQNEYKNDADAVLELADVPRVLGDAGDLCLAILNLIINAAHAMREQREATGKRGVLTLTTRSSGDRVEIVVADTGPGIPDTVRKRIFEPFFTTKPVGQGTGQGLPIARATIVERHGGTLELETQVGVGTRFIIGLPVGRNAS